MVFEVYKDKYFQDGKNMYHHLQNCPTISFTGMKNILRRSPTEEEWENFLSCKEPYNLILDGAILVPADMERFRGHDNILSLSLSGTGLTDEMIEMLPDVLPDVHILKFSGTPVTDKGFASLTRMKSLFYISAFCSKITGKCFSSMTDYPLEALGLAGSKKLNEAGIRSICSMKTLLHLDLRYTGLRNDWLSDLHKLENLITLGLDRCRHLTDDGIAHLASITSLRRLSLRENKKLTDECMKSISNLINLQELDIKDCRKISDAGLSYLTRMRYLSKFNGEGCSTSAKDFEGLKIVLMLYFAAKSDFAESFFGGPLKRKKKEDNSEEESEEDSNDLKD